MTIHRLKIRNKERKKQSSTLWPITEFSYWEIEFSHLRVVTYHFDSYIIVIPLPLMPGSQGDWKQWKQVGSISWTCCHVFGEHTGKHCVTEVSEVNMLCQYSSIMGLYLELLKKTTEYNDKGLNTITMASGLCRKVQLWVCIDFKWDQAKDGSTW